MPASIAPELQSDGKPMIDGRKLPRKHQQQDQNKQSGAQIGRNARSSNNNSKWQNSNQLQCLVIARTDSYGQNYAREDGERRLLKSLPNGPAQTGESSAIPFYPAYTHNASPTYFKWVNLTAHQIHTELKRKEGFTHTWQASRDGYSRDPAQLLFYLNHPIQFVQVVGIVVSLEEWFERFWLFTIDDSSGSTIDVRCQKPQKSGPEQKEVDVKEDDCEKGGMEQVAKLSDEVRCKVQIGAVLQIKGTITLFQRSREVRGIMATSTSANDQVKVQAQEPPTRQIALARVTSLHDTSREIALIEARTRFYRDVLSKQWQLTKRDQQKLHRRAMGEAEHDRKRTKKHAATFSGSRQQEKHDKQCIVEQYEEEEQLRQTKADKAQQAGKALKVEQTSTISTSSRITDPENSVTGFVDKEDSVIEVVKPTQPKKKRRKTNKSTTQHAAVSVVDHDTSMSFNIDDEERSALLRAAFG